MKHLGSVKMFRRAAPLAVACLCAALFNLPGAEAGRAASPAASRAQESAAQAVAPPKVNGKIAFTSGRGTEGLDVYVMNPDGTGLARLTDGKSYNDGPAWSPDGRTLAFVSNRDGRAFHVYLMNADGREVRQLTNGTEDDGTPAWSPDGTKIVFARGFAACIAVVGQPCPGPDLFVINADGTGERQLTSGRVGDAYPSWSPDGSKIAFNSLRTGISEIFVMNPDGTGQTNVSNSPKAQDYDPAWSPDGTKIAFTSLRDNHFNVFVMNADGSNQTNLTGNLTNEIIENPAWSPDGTKIAFARFLLINGGQGENRDLFVMNADGSNQTRLTFDPAFDVEPDWQPVTLAANGRVLFTSERDGNPEVYSMNPDGSSQTNLTSNAARDFNPVWSPDGTRVLFASDRSGGTFHRELFVMSADGTDVRPVTRARNWDGSPDWGPRQ
jgi:Tol biopolymer transport system component